MIGLASIITEWVNTHLPSYSALAKIGAWTNFSGLSVVAMSSGPVSIFGQSLDEWKVYGVIAGAVCGILGLIVQVTFKWLDYRHKVKLSGLMNRRKDDQHKLN